MRIFLTLSFYLFCWASFSQGCSDAGFCTMGAMKPDQTFSKRIDFKLRSLELNYYRGKSLLSPVITVLTADMTFGITDYFAVQIKAPYQMVEGNFGETRGIGDFSFSATRSIPLRASSIGLTIGAKIPSGRSDIEGELPEDRFSEEARNNPSQFGSAGDLPMYYQVSLGTYDFVAGASVINDKWLWATGIQIPVIHQNENNYRWGDWSAYRSQSYNESHDLANYLKRGTDVMLRSERNFRFINFNFGVGLLAIYRITKDRVYDFFQDPDETYDPDEDELIKQDGTTGLALNLLMNVGYSFNVNNSVRFIYGQKLADRPVNPDGLTRRNVISVSYVYRF